MQALLDGWTDGCIKLLLIAKLLRLRRAHDALFRDGAYVPLTVAGPHAERICAFARVAGAEALVVAVPRLVATLGDGAEPPLGACWEDTTVLCPSAIPVESWTDVLTGATIDSTVGEGDAPLAAHTLFANLPVAALFGRLRASASEN